MEPLTENAIRPEHLMQEHARLFEEDVARLVSQKDRFVKASCPACDSDTPVRIFQKYGIDFQLCQNCETIYISPRPSPDLLDEFYGGSKHYAYWNDFIFPASEEVRRNKIFRPRVDRVKGLVEKYRCPTDMFLEVGAGYGTFCEELSKDGIFKEILAVEPTPGLAETCRRKGITILEQTVESLDRQAISADFVA
ncbi:MAG: class I SAM-dependent methyltransferase, partial [Terrimicrobiaceae bacterium]